MASRALKPLRGALEGEMIPIVGIINIAADASISSVEGKGFTAAYAATGVYTVTLDDKWSAIRGAFAQFEAATLVDLDVQTVSHSASSQTVVFKTFAVDAEGAVAAAAPAAACAIHFQIWVRNSSV
jgi:hypothetical protein